MLYISTQVRRKLPQKTRQMDCWAIFPQPAAPQPGISPTVSWTDADSLTLEQICKDLGISETELDPCMPHPPAQFQTDVLRTPESRPRKAAACPTKTRIKSTKMAVTPILGRINATRLPNGRYQKLQLPALLVKSQSEVSSPTTTSMAVAATWTSAPDATLTSPTMSNTSTTPSSSNLPTLIYSNFTIDHLKSKSTLELNLNKNLFRKFFYPQLILFLDKALSAQPQSHKSLDSVISFALCFLGL